MLTTHCFCIRSAPRGCSLRHGRPPGAARRRARRARRALGLAARAHAELRGGSSGCARAPLHAALYWRCSAGCRAMRAMWQRWCRGGRGWLLAGSRSRVPQSYTCTQIPVCERAKAQHTSGRRCLTCGARRTPAMQRLSQAAARLAPLLTSLRAAAAGVGGWGGGERAWPPVSGSRPSSMRSPRTRPCSEMSTRYRPSTRPSNGSRPCSSVVGGELTYSFARTERWRPRRRGGAPGIGARDPPCAGRHACLDLSCACLAVWHASLHLPARIS